MVHALELIWRLLKPEGRLVDIRPFGEAPPVEFVDGENRMVLGLFQETDGFVEYARAEAAMQQAREKGWFSDERQGEISFVMHADSVAELRDYLDKNYSDAILVPEIEAWADELFQAVEKEGARRLPYLELIEHTRINRMKRGLKVSLSET